MAGRTATKRTRTVALDSRAPDTASLTPKQSDRRRRVIEAAMALATDGGYEAVQMRDVAAEAKVALGTLYRYFPSKDQLLVAALGEWAEEFWARSRAPRGDTKADRVAAVLRGTLRALEKEPKLSSAFVTALAALDPDEPGSLDRAAAVYQTMATMISAAMDGEDVEDRETLMRVLGQMWFAVLVFWVRGWSPGNQMEDDLEAAARLMIRD